MKPASRLLPVLVAMLLAGCAARNYYDGVQAGRRHQCERYQEPERTRCLESTDVPYDDYERERARMGHDTD